ncbi:uncharacterized protein LOC116434101 [Nomia melanderi]|uniref:uncharacterized protein LOC116434101 n=1 Tax=Nomia melanderi TaxID=2448451 RepID=UPI003FCD4A90
MAVCARDARITSITIDGIPLSSRYLNILCLGLRNNETLTHLSLTRCRIGDVGCNSVLESLGNNPNLCILNLSGCRLTRRSAMSLYLFLKRRGADLLQNVWVETSAETREYHSAGKVQGLQKLILNQNPKFGDNGVQQLMYAVKFDCWLKSLSFRHCGITKQGAENIINVLQSNSVLKKVDLTQNRIPINTFQVLRKILKKRQETVEDKLLKKRCFVNWKKASIKQMFQKNNIRGSASRNAKQLLNASSKHNRNTLSKNYPFKRFPRIRERSNQLKRIKNTKREPILKKKNLRILEGQLLDIIDSNTKLMKEWMDNKALLATELQERSRTESEMKNVSSQLNDLKSKVIVANFLRLKLSDENELLQRNLQHFLGKLENLLITEQQPDAEK